MRPTSLDLAPGYAALSELPRRRRPRAAQPVLLAALVLGIAFGGVAAGLVLIH